MNSAIAIVFRGSTTTEDWVANLTVVPNWGLEGRIHSDFWNRACKIPLNPILSMLEEGNRVIFSGHSHGSAVAELPLIR